jgi:hypothetical protein
MGGPTQLVAFLGMPASRLAFHLNTFATTLREVTANFAEAMRDPMTPEERAEAETWKALLGRLHAHHLLWEHSMEDLWEVGERHPLGEARKVYWARWNLLGHRPGGHHRSRRR